MIKKIVGTKDPVLRQISKPVGKIDTKITDLIRDLKDTLAAQKDPEGVGLAAPQIGKNLRIFATNYGDFKKVFINPEIISTTETNKKKKGKTRLSKNEILEGCLSLPNFYGPLTRSKVLTIKYTDENGQEKVEEFRDFEAQIILHEIDHLNGILFVDRLLEQKKPLYELKGQEWEEVEI